MYCPNCGQQQVADSTRFCSRCGLALSGLAEWLAGGGVATAREEAAPAPLSPRRKGIRRGAKLVFLSFVLMPIFFGIAVAMDHPLPLIFPCTVFFAGVSWMLYSRLFGENTPAAEGRPRGAHGLGAAHGGAALPPASQPAYVPPPQRARTAELAQPPSVTESTTRLLDRDG